jgi:hypothetical protein
MQSVYLNIENKFKRYKVKSKINKIIVLSGKGGTGKNNGCFGI